MKTKPVVIYGNGAMAKVMSAYVPAQFFSIEREFFTINELRGKPVIPLDLLLDVAPPADYDVLVAIGFTGMNYVREAATETLKAMGYTIKGYQHPSLVLDWRRVYIGPEAVLLDHVTLHPDTYVGQGTWLTGHNAIGHDCHIGCWCWLNSGVTLAGGVTVGGGTVFGINACVADDVHIGKRCYIGAGAVIAHDVPDNAVMISETGQRFPLPSIEFLKWRQAP